MKKKYIKPTTTTLKVQGTNTLMAGSKPHLNGSVEGIQPDNNFGIDISWGGSSKQDTQKEDEQGRLWAD